MNSLSKWQLLPAADFPSHHDAWNALQENGHSVPFLDSYFLQPLLEEFGTGRELLAVAYDGNRLDAGALLVPTKVGFWQTFQPSQLPLGPWIALPGADLARHAQRMLKVLPGLALGVGMTQIDPLIQARPAPQATTTTQDYIDTAWVDVTGTFSDYWESRGKNLRTNIRKQRSKLESDGICATLECVRHPDQVEQAMSEYGRLESAGWKAAGGTAISSSNAQGRFYTIMLKNFCAQGRGSIYRYKFNEKTVAMDLCIQSNRTLVILKTAYDESNKSLSPSSLMRYEQFKDIFESRELQRIEFYGRVMEWHTRWTQHSRTLFHSTTYRWPIVRALHQHIRGASNAQEVTK